MQPTKTEQRILSTGNLAGLLSTWARLEPDRCSCIDLQQRIYWVRSPVLNADNNHPGKTIHAVCPDEIGLAWLQRVVMRCGESRSLSCGYRQVEPEIYAAHCGFLIAVKATDPAIAMLAAYLEALKQDV